MFSILSARFIAPDIKRFRVHVPRVARHWRPGQFVIVRPAESSERIPLTVAEVDRTEGWIGLVVQGVGKTTSTMNSLETGDCLVDVAGPLGTPSHIAPFGTVVVIGGGVGTAIAYPTAAAFGQVGNRVLGIIGARSRGHLILEEEMNRVCEEVFPATDDGSYGKAGLVTDLLADLLASGRRVNRVLAIGPIPMMRAVAELTRLHAIPTVVSLNPIMVDGTGMCGGCRVLVGEETRFACVDGPEFDAHLVDFDLLTVRNRAYHEFEEHRRQGCMSGVAG